MWDDIQIQCSDAFEIAEALINKEVKLNLLKSIAAFAPKADLTEDAVWNYCRNHSSFQRYLEIYPDGKYKTEVEEYIWRAAIERNDMNSFMAYLNSYPQGRHAAEVDDNVWEIAKANGSFSAYLHFFSNGKHTDEARGLLVARQIEEDAWTEAEGIDTPESYRGYIELYPQGLHTNEAKKRIAELMQGQKEIIIRALAEDRNAYNLNYIKACGITAEDLRGRITDSNGNVRDEVLKSWNKSAKNLQMGTMPSGIPSGSTEVYFWGVPGSGKTCAMAAILSMANQMGFFEPREGEGLGYMTELSTAFISEPHAPAVYLPTSSAIETTQYLPLTLNEPVEKNRIKEHQLSIVEISGEIFECFALELQHRPFKTDNHKNTYNQLKSYLQSTENPKYHFFILDSQPTLNSNQMAYLQQAALYFRNNKIFNDTTQGISLIVTKTDTLSPNRDEWVNCATKAAGQYFGALVTSLKKIVGPTEYGGLGLSNGDLDVIPLSIGEVFFKSLCLFDPQPASVLVNLLMKYAKADESNSRWNRARGIFRK